MIPDYVTDKTCVYIVYENGIFKDGKTSFDLFWWQENFHQGPSWRGQCFHADPDPYIQSNRKHFTVVERLRGSVNILPRIQNKPEE